MWHICRTYSVTLPHNLLYTYDSSTYTALLGYYYTVHSTIGTSLMRILRACTYIKGNRTLLYVHASSATPHKLLYVVYLTKLSTYKGTLAGLSFSAGPEPPQGPPHEDDGAPRACPAANARLPPPARRDGAVGQEAQVQADVQRTLRRRPRLRQRDLLLW